MAKGFTVKANTPKPKKKQEEWDYAKAKEILGWEPKTEFKDMVALMVKEDIKRLSNDIR